MERLVGDMLDRLVLWLRDEVNRRLILVLGEVAIDAVVAGIDATADKPSPEWRGARVERDVPRLVPVEKVGVLLEVFGKLVEAESLEDGLVFQVGLSNEFLWRMEVSLFLPMDGDLCLRYICGSILRHALPPRQWGH